jgi:hypothetical protein
VEAGLPSPSAGDDREATRFPPPCTGGGGDWEEVSFLARETLEHGNGARRQREVYGRAGRLQDVVDMLIEETSQGMAEAP